MLPSIPTSQLAAARQRGPEAYLQLINDATMDTVCGVLDGDTMSQLTAEQITLIAYCILREEVMEGGFIQLIHNGYGSFIFINPFAKVLRLWSEELQPAERETLHDFSNKIYKGRRLFEQFEKELTTDLDDDEFMALYEQYPLFDPLDDYFVDAEEHVTAAIAAYVEAHINLFCSPLLS